MMNIDTDLVGTMGLHWFGIPFVPVNSLKGVDCRKMWGKQMGPLCFYCTCLGTFLGIVVHHLA